MVTCLRCGKADTYRSPVCPHCGTPYVFSDEDIEARLSAVRRGGRRKDDAYAESCHILADLGRPEGVRLYGALLEQMGHVDHAVGLYRAHADADPYAAYRYAIHARHTDAQQSFFRLRFASYFGCEESFEPMAEAFAERSQTERAMYFFRLASDRGSRTASIALARLYIDRAKEDDLGYARYMLGRTSLASLRTPRLYAKVKACAPIEPPLPDDTFRIPALYELANEAERLGERSVYATLCERLLSMGRTDMQATVARLLIAGDGCPQDVTRGLSLLHALSDRGDTAAAIRLGDLYQKGSPIPKDYARALTYYQRAAEFGDGRGYERLGDYYRAGVEDRPRIARAIELYEQGAAHGSTDAARKARDLKAQREHYYTRAMNERDSSPKDAYRHFVAAADMGYLPAEVRIGDCYLVGIGVPVNRRRAFLWYKYAAEHKNEEAYYPLAMCYSRGVGTPFNYREALTYLRRAHALGCEPAMEEATRLLEARRKKKERALHACVCELLYQGKAAEAAPLAELSAGLGNGKALYTLGAMYEFGIGVRSDGQTAADLYARAEEAGFTDERAHLKRILLRQANARHPAV